MGKMKLNAKAAGMALGCLTGLGMLVWGMLALTNGWGAEAVPLVGSFYKGFDMTVNGVVIGVVWGFIDGFLGGWIGAMLYNAFAKMK